MASSPLASRTVGRHYARGLVGLLAAVATVVGSQLGVAAAPALLLVVVVAWRGCPTCWAVGLMQTRAGGAGVDGPRSRR